MKKLRPYDAILIVMLVLCVATVIVFGVPGIIVYADEKLGPLVRDTVPRLAVGALLTVYILKSEYKATLVPRARGIWKSLIWCVPCFAVAVVNFPFSALINGVAVIERVDLVWLFLLKCLSVAWMEELFFRAVLVPLAQKRFESVKGGTVWAVAVSSAVFGLFHFINLFYGASVSGTLLQVGYTFLIGCMLAVTLIKTQNVWLCIAVHFIFDIGGMIVTDLGRGAFQDGVFWALTVAAGAACFVFIVAELVRIERNKFKADANRTDSAESEK